MNRRQVFLVKSMIERLNHVLFRAEVVIGVPERNSGAPGDGPHRCLFVPVIIQEVERAVQDQFTSLLALGRLSRFVIRDCIHFHDLDMLVATRLI